MRRRKIKETAQQRPGFISHPCSFLSFTSIESNLGFRGDQPRVSSVRGHPGDGVRCGCRGRRSRLGRRLIASEVTILGSEIAIGRRATASPAYPVGPSICPYYAARTNLGGNAGGATARPRVLLRARDKSESLSSSRALSPDASSDPAILVGSLLFHATLFLRYGRQTGWASRSPYIPTGEHRSLNALLKSFVSP